jgi:histidine triad (HIT) family protein
MRLERSASGDQQVAFPDDQPDDMLYDSLAGCPFCERLKTLEFEAANADAVTFAPLNPVVPGHMLVVPRHHVANAAVSPYITGTTVAYACERVRAMGQDSNMIINVGKDAGQSVFHLHVHILPRVPGDDVVMPWTRRTRNAMEETVMAAGYKALNTPPVEPQVRTVVCYLPPGYGPMRERGR